MNNYANQPNYRATKRTVYDLREAAKHVRAGLAAFNPPASELAAHKLLAQAMFETDNFKSCYNHNWGNVKCDPAWGRPFQMMRCNEIIAGSTEWFDPPHIQSCFAAFDTPEAGAHDWMKLIITHPRYERAAGSLFNDSLLVADFVHRLKVCRYFTASEGIYAREVTKKMAVAELAFNGRRILEMGMFGDDVAEWQAIVGANQDGKFGDNTRTATKVWQTAHGLTVDGEVGPKTWGSV